MMDLVLQRTLVHACGKVFSAFLDLHRVILLPHFTVGLYSKIRSEGGCDKHDISPVVRQPSWGKCSTGEVAVNKRRCFGDDVCEIKVRDPC